jgi:hypothetical protein
MEIPGSLQIKGVLHLFLDVVSDRAVLFAVRTASDVCDDIHAVFLVQAIAPALFPCLHPRRIGRTLRPVAGVSILQ